MQKRLVVEQFDPERPVPGGIDTCIRGLVRYCPPDIELRLVGVDAIGNKSLGEWREYEIGGKIVAFMPVAHVDYVNLQRRVPHSVRVGLGLQRYRPALDADVVQTHRINTGAVAMRLYPRAQHVQFIHTENDLKKGSQSFFRHAEFIYRWLERKVIPRTVDVVMFSKSGAERLRKISPHVRFSPTWFDPAEFYPAASETTEKTKILWACRIEPGKNPDLAVDVMSALPSKYTLTVAGSGTAQTAMEERARRSPAADRITFAGAIPKAEMGALMRDHHLMLMTSSFEGFSRSVVEGLASGLPVVTTLGGEPNGLVETGVNGVRVEGYDARSFVGAVDLAATLSAVAARDSVAALNAEHIVPRVLTIPRHRGANSLDSA